MLCCLFRSTVIQTFKVSVLSLHETSPLVYKSQVYINIQNQIQHINLQLYITTENQTHTGLTDMP